MPKFSVRLATASAATALGLGVLAPAASFADTSITTGSSNVSVSISNSVNSNIANLSQTDGGMLLVNVSDNGSRSSNHVGVVLNSNTVVRQSNAASISNNVNIDSNTGVNMSGRHVSSFCAIHPWMSWCN